MARHVVRPTLAAVREVLPLGQQSLVQLAGEQRDAVHPGVVAKPVTGHADLAAATGAQQGLIEIGPGLDGRFLPAGVAVPMGTTRASRGSRHESVKQEVRLY